MMQSDKTPRYRLVALDLDGTLLGPELQIHPRDREAIAAAQRAGVYVTIATGRAFPPTRRFAAELGITTPLICFQGGLIRDPGSGEVLFEAVLPEDLYAEAVELAQAQNLDFSAYVGDAIYLTELRHPQEFYDRWFALPMHRVDDLLSLPRAPDKFLITAEPDQADRIEAEWKAHFDGRLQIVRSHPLFVEGTPLGVSKGDALARLARHLGVPCEAVIAVGDNDNDRSMIRWAGLGVAMATAPEDLKAEADVVAPPQSEAGVAWVLERFVLR
jgi:hypothetical protein